MLTIWAEAGLAGGVAPHTEVIVGVCVEAESLAVAHTDVPILLSLGEEHRGKARGAFLLRRTRAVLAGFVTCYQIVRNSWTYEGIYCCRLGGNNL